MALFETVSLLGELGGDVTRESAGVYQLVALTLIDALVIAIPAAVVTLIEKIHETADESDGGRASAFRHCAAMLGATIGPEVS